MTNSGKEVRGQEDAVLKRVFNPANIEGRKELSRRSSITERQSSWLVRDMIKDENTPLVGGQPLGDVVIETGGKQLESKTACGKTSPNKPSLFKLRREVRARRQGKAKKKTVATVCDVALFSQSRRLVVF